jgi:signal transduction histidine kinase
MTARDNCPFDVSENIINEVASPVFILDGLLRVVQWNRAIAAMTAISPDQIRGLPFAESVLFPEDVPAWTGEINRLSDEYPRIKVNNRWKAGGLDVTRAVASACVFVSTGSAKHIVCTVENPGPAVDRASISRQILEDRAAELRQISRFLHDTISQDLVHLSFAIHSIHDAARDLPVLSETATALKLIDRCCRDIRILACTVSPLYLAESTFDSAIEQHAAYFNEETGVSMSLDVDPAPSMPLDIKFLLFAVVQMWAARSFRAGREGTVAIRLRSLADAAVLELEVRAAPSVLRPVDFLEGWSIIRERVAALGGRFGIDAGSDYAQARLWLPGVSVESTKP